MFFFCFRKLGIDNSKLNKINMNIYVKLFPNEELYTMYNLFFLSFFPLGWLTYTHFPTN
uniref:Uncharacterized protein n=1 Tax=Anguilla anguilla TaxID=7936 RepID=A0A0E9VN50_ANGAN